MAETQYIKEYRHDQDTLLKLRLSIRIEKNGEFKWLEYAMFISARQACLSISETDLEFSTQSSIGFMENYPKRENIQLAAVLQVKWPCWCQRTGKMARLLSPNRKATVI